MRGAPTKAAVAGQATSALQRDLATLWRRLAVPVAVLLLTHIVGTIGFWLLWRDEGGTLGDGLFMTFVTVTTIGYGEVRPLDGAGRALSMLIAAGGIGTVFYSFTVVLDWVGSDEVRAARRRRRVQREIDTLSGHYLLVGYGRVGREASSELGHGGARIAVIDVDAAQIAAAADAGLPGLCGDGADDGVLRAAGIERAKGLLVTTASDATNLFVVMSARLLAPQVHIVSRVADAATMPKLERAGANRAISPYAIGGRRMAHLMLGPHVVDFFETALRRGTQSLSIGEVLVPTAGLAAGRPLEAFRQPDGATILAVVRGREGAILSPVPGLTLAAGDHILALGTEPQLAAIEAAIGA